MKKLLFVLLFIFPSFCHAQSVQEVDSICAIGTDSNGFVKNYGCSFDNVSPQMWFPSSEIILSFSSFTAYQAAMQQDTTQPTCGPCMVLTANGIALWTAQEGHAPAL